MAHFAQLDENNFVTNVIVVNNDDCLDDSGMESEAVGIAFCKSVFGEDTRWAQTSYNASFRKMYASIGGFFDPDANAFTPAKPFPSWVFDKGLWNWVAPVSYPNDGQKYAWDENTLSWIEIERLA